MELNCCNVSCSKLFKKFIELPVWKKKVNISGTIPVPVLLIIVGLIVTLICLEEK